MRLPLKPEHSEQNEGPWPNYQGTTQQATKEVRELDETF